MYCHENSETVTDQECVDCGECENCGDAEERLNKVAKGLDSELAAKLQGQLAGVLGYSEEEASLLLANFFGGLQKTIAGQVKNCISELSRNFVIAQMKNRFANYLDNSFEEAIAARITVVSRDSEFIKTSIQEIVTQKVKGALSTSDTRGKRDYTEKALQKVIEERVDEMVKESLNELKAETIEKFTKDIMKKMMVGMAGAIADDKRLLAAIGK